MPPLSPLEKALNSSHIVVTYWRVPNQHGSEKALLEYISQSVSLWGYDAADLISGKVDFYELIDHRQQSAMVLRWDKAIEAQEDCTLEYEIRKADGRKIRVRDHRVKELSSDGTLYYVGTLTEQPEPISDHKDEASNNDARAVVARHDALLDATTDFIFYKDREGHYQESNQRFSELIGCQPSELLGKTASELFPKESVEPAAQRDSEVLSREKSVEQVSWVEYPNGQRLLVNVLKRPYYDQQGQLLGLMGIGRDITKAHANEERIKGHNRYLQAIIDAIDEMVFVINEEYQIETMNYEAQKQMGSPVLQQMMQSECCQIEINRCAPCTLENGSCSMDRVFKSGEAVSSIQEVEISGKQYAYEFSFSPLFTPEGAVSHVVEVIRDVTAYVTMQYDLKHKAERLAETQKMLLQAQRLVHMGSWEMDLENRTLFWSDEIYNIAELEKEKFQPSYEAFLKLVHPDDRQRVDTVYKDSLKLKIPYEVEHKLQMPDGRVKYVVQQCRTDFDDMGNPLRSLGTIQDISSRKRMEIDLKEQRDAFEAIYQKSSDGVLLIQNGKLIDCNEAVLKMLHAEDKAHVYYRHPAEFSPFLQPDGEDSRIKMNRMIDVCLAEGVSRGEWKFATLNGESFMVEMVLTHIIIHESDTIHMVWRDISERIALQEKSDEDKKMLFQQSKMAQMGDMLNSIAHQWKQPLAQINSVLIELSTISARDGIDHDMLQDRLDKIEDLTFYMADTIESFKNYLDPKKEKEQFSIAQLFEEVLRLIEPSLEKESISLMIHYEECFMMTGYMKELMQVLLILFNNAREALLERQVENPRIDVFAEKEDDKHIIHVIDNGGGIENDIIERIFEPYFTTKELNGGTGLGLYLAKVIIENGMGGTLSCFVKKPMTQFTIIL